MTSRTYVTVGIVLVLIAVPFLIAQAQSDETEAVAGEVLGETVANPVEPETAPEQQQISEETQPAPDASSDPETTQEATAPETPQAQEGATTTPATTELPTNTASSSAEEQKPVEPYVPPEPTFVLQPAVKLSVAGNTVSADIQLENLTCKACDKVLPDLDVIAYYTSWYPNDGEILENGQSAVQELTVSNLANFAKRDMTWSAQVPPGHYYFVIVVDPQNKHDAYRVHRSEFTI
jgi:hypothetical protein